MNNHYQILGLQPTASAIEIRRAYRELSKLYHPDTTNLPVNLAVQKFQELNQSYGILSHPETRSNYDRQMGYSRFSVIQVPHDFNIPNTNSNSLRSSAYLDPSDRPLSPGEVFVLLLLGFCFLGCIFLVFILAIIRENNMT